MTNPDYTHLSLIVDRSGSMDSVREEAQSGITALLRDQYALGGKLTVTLTEFDSKIHTVARMSEEPLTYRLDPQDMTALYDAVGCEITATGEDLSALSENERPGRVLVVVVTDGAENASREYDLEQVRAMVNHQRDFYNWDFQFIGAGEAAWQGEAVGMASATYSGSPMGATAVYSRMSDAITNYRSAPMGAAFIMEDVIEDEHN